MDIGAIQAYLEDRGLDGWLMADFHGRNDIAVNMLQIKGMLTRRAFYFIPTQGEPVAMVNSVEKEKFKGLPGTIEAYAGYRQLEASLDSLLADKKKVAMEYSPKGRLPYIGLVDAGTIELVRSSGIEIVSSADLVASFQAILTPRQIETHRTAAARVVECKTSAFDAIAQALISGKRITEYDVATQIRSDFDKFGLKAGTGPICAVGPHAGDPHYEPTADNCAEIKRGDLILVDLWAQTTDESSIYADITWMAFAGSSSDIPTRFVEIHKVLTRARDAAVDYLDNHIGKRRVCGYEVDDVCREVIRSAGYGDYFVHRTGHSITTTEHGTGPNIDNLETEDDRELQVGHLFSIEPGIYTDDFGLRTEINALIVPDGCEVTTQPVQNEIAALF
ncbi:MAG: aminopeptidase P family protein [Candidatus Zixiibacteriota bacterium]|nr:MAG: aminopeptidase P family protein [candidate division Zixibacteria bacterium]